MIPLLRPAYAAGILAAVISLATLSGCLSADMEGQVDPGDPFPKPIGETLIPFKEDFNATFRYTGFDATGALTEKDDLSLHVMSKGKGMLGYAFEDDSQGLLLAFRTFTGNPDSTGIWIMGTYRDSVWDLDSIPVLWLPHYPRMGVSWEISPGRKTELVDADTTFWTETLFPHDGDEKAPARLGFQRQPTTLFRETKADTVTYYHFRKGVGCVGFERTAGGKLIATGSLYQFFGRTKSSGGYYNE